jgi:outer membrane receptor protein involved in Fe transport
VTQPYASQVFTPAALVAPGSLAGSIDCTGLTIIGTVGNPTLLPERADDVDVSYGHRFGLDSQIQISAYSENINDKIFPVPINVNTLPSGLINTGPYSTIVNSECGVKPGVGALGVDSESNIGRLLARGLDVAGRQRVILHHLFFDYDYSIETSVIQSAPWSCSKTIRPTSSVLNCRASRRTSGGLPPTARSVRSICA